LRFTMHLSIFLSALALLPTTLAQLSGSVGPTTNTRAKTTTKTCDITAYGAKADKTTDIGPPLAAAWAACQNGGVVDGNMIMIRDTTDFEFFSSTGKGAIQGSNGYEVHKAQGQCKGARLLRTYRVTNFSIHDVVLVDAPMYHLVMDSCTNGEVYNMAIRAGEWGCLDGIDLVSNNIHIHDVMITNKDECVTVKSPSKNILVENIYCNWSGGSAIGSLGTGTAISQVVYRNIYTWKSNQMFMIKSNGGSGYLEDVVLENFIGHGNAWSLDIDQEWSSMSKIEGNGVQLSNFTIRNWKGTEANGASRGPIKLNCADGAPCTDFKITDFAMWTETGNKQ
ncbi:pectin lyase-like protein, partial [Bimuria novae-zelandiae CBS 107.79]